MTLAVNIAQSGSNNATFRNRIINGAMVFDQRNAGASVTPTNGSYTLDRWNCGITQASKFTVQQNAGSVTPPAGFKNYLGITSTSSYSIGSGDIFYVKQPIEGFNVSDLEFGTANAKTVTLSFWVRSSLTGSFGGALQNSAENRSYPFSYTISTANTWEYETVTIAGDTSGTWLTTNGIGLSVVFGLGNGATYSGTANAWAGAQHFAPTGSVSVVGTNGATFYITGVQLEVGSTATSFDYRAWNIEKYLCERYCQTTYAYGTAPGSSVGFGGIIGRTGLQSVNSSAEIYQSTQFRQQMRTTPTISFYDTAGNPAKVTGTTYGVVDTTNISGSVGQSSMNGFGVTASANGYGSISYHYLVTAEL